MADHERPRMKRHEGGLYIGSHNGKTINAHKAYDDNGRWIWVAKAEGGHGSMIVAKAKTMKQAIERVIDDFWF